MSQKAASDGFLNRNLKYQRIKKKALVVHPDRPEYLLL